MMQSTQGGGNEFCEEFKEESSEKEESLEEVLSRHSKEVKIIHDKEKSLKKAAAKGSKAEQKAKKKKVDEEINLLLSNLKTKHQQELASLGYKKNSTQENNNINNLAMTMSGISITNPSAPPKPTRSAKRKEKRAQQEAEREQRIQEEQSTIISDRMIENEKLEQKLEPLGLTVNEIKPDGHCLYRAVEDQLSQQAGTSPYNYQELRELVAAYMREHSEDFLPFFLDDDKIATNGDTNLSEMFESYCKEVESTALWGGQLELGALTHCLKKHIVIFSGSFPEIEMGKEYKPKLGNSFDPSSIMLSYHKHAFGLGEHYNSVIPSSIK